MNRVALFILLLCVGLTACRKSSEGGLAGYRAQAAIDDKIIADFLKANPTLIATKIDTSGVYYIITKQGDGSDLFTNSTQVTVGYEGRVLTSGQRFAKTESIHPSFVLAQVIKGWQLGIPHIKKGGIIRLLIPSRYAYGPAPQPLLGVPFGLKDGLPANAVLDFDIQLFDVIN